MDARTHFPLDDQIGPQTEDQGLLRHAEKLAAGRYRTSAVTGDGLQGDLHLVAVVPALAQIVEHAHGLDDLAVAQVVVRVVR